MPAGKQAQRRIAILASENMMPGARNERDDAFERDEQMGKLVPALAGLGLGCDLRPWRHADRLAGDYDAMLPLLCWDYWDHREQFLGTLEAAARTTRIFNSPTLLRANTDKAYLAELASRGAPVIPEWSVEFATDAIIRRAFERFETDTLVVKPRIGGGAWRQVLVRKGEPLPPESERPPAGALIQPFLRAIVDEGEVSLLFFDGRFSHGLRKIAKSGDYRIQSSFGGREEPYMPYAGMIALATRVLGMLDEVPLYARVDLLRGNDGAWKLIEVEMVEPYLYFGLSKGERGSNRGARALAVSLWERLES